MKSHLRRTAAVALAVVLCLPVVASASQRVRDRDTDKSPVVRAINKIKQILGITLHNGMPGPPIPKP